MQGTGEEKKLQERRDQRVRRTGRVAVQSSKSCVSRLLNAAREAKNEACPTHLSTKGAREGEKEGSGSKVCKKRTLT